MENNFAAIDQAQAARFKRLLEDKKINQAELAREAGVSHLTDMKTGRRPINIRVIKAIFEREDLGYKALNWILLGVFEQEVFATVNTENLPVGIAKQALESTIAHERKGYYYPEEDEVSSICFLSALFKDTERALIAIKNLIYIEKLDGDKYDEILEKIFGAYINLNHKNEKKFQSDRD